MTIVQEYSGFIDALRARRSAGFGSHQETDGRVNALSGISRQGSGKAGQFIRDLFEKVRSAFGSAVDRSGNRDDERCVHCSKVGGRQGHSPAGDR